MQRAGDLAPIEPPASTQPPDTTTSIATIASTTTTTTTSITVATVRNPVDPSTIHGTWRTPHDASQFFLIFHADGSWKAGYTREPKSPFDFGTYEFDGRRLTIHSSPEATSQGSPCAGLTGTYDTSFTGDGFVLPASGAEDECARRQRDLVAGVFARVSD